MTPARIGDHPLATALCQTQWIGIVFNLCHMAALDAVRLATPLDSSAIDAIVEKWLLSINVSTAENAARFITRKQEQSWSK